MDISGEILFCDTIQMRIVNGRAEPSIVRPLSFIEPVGIPSNYSYAVYCSVSDLPVADHDIKVSLFDTKGSKLYDIDMPVKNDGRWRTEGDTFERLELTIDIRNAVIDKEGKISAVLEVDGNELTKADLEVRKREKQG